MDKALFTNPFDRIRQLEQENQALKGHVDELETTVQNLMSDMSELVDEYDIDDYDL